MFKRLFVIVMLLMIVVLPTLAQDITLVPFTDESFGIQGVMPEGWSQAQSGIYVRGSSATDTTLIVFQAAPVAQMELVSILTQQMGLEGEIESVGTYESATFTWDLYSEAIESPALGTGIADLALANADGKTYFVMLVTSADEYEGLHESIFIPAIDALTLMVEVEEEVPYIQEDITFTNGDVTLAGTLTLPDTVGPHPAIILVTGALPQDRDASMAPTADIKPFKLIADHLTRNGFAVLRYDDRGAGQSTGNYAESTIYDFALDASAGIDYLLTREDINPEQVGMLGHSEGGAIAPMIARENGNLAFIISMAGTGTTYIDVAVEQIRQSFVLADVSEGESFVGSETRRLAMELVLMGENEIAEDYLRALFVGSLVQEMTEDESTTPAEIYEQIDPFVTQLMDFYTSPEIFSLMEYDPSDDWQAVNVPVLALFGGVDFQVPAEMNVVGLEDLLANNADTTIITFPTANHLFQDADTGGREEYGTLEQTFLPDFLPTITDWLLERVDIVE